MLPNNAKYHCNYCDENICNIRIRCSECTDFDLCLECFSSGAEIGSHRKRHAYQIIDCGTFEIYTSLDNESRKWKASDETLLLEAVELYGFGNWTDISEYLRSHSAEDVEKHFLNYYVYGNIGQLTWSSVKDNAIDVIDNTIGDIDDDEEYTCVNDNESPIEEHGLLGFMPKRNDYEREYDNEAESLVSYLSVQNNDEDNVEVDLKLASIEIFNRRLRERIRKKHIACEYKLVDAFFKSNAHQNSLSTNNQQLSPLSVTSLPVSNNATIPKQSIQLPPSNQISLHHIHKKDSLSNDLKIFSQFVSNLEHAKLIANLRRENELKSRIKDLHRYRRNGITRLIECNHFESGRFKRDKRKENKNKKKSIGNMAENIGLDRKQQKIRNLNQPLMNHQKTKTLGSSKKSQIYSSQGSYTQNNNNETQNSKIQKGIDSKESNVLVSDHLDQEGQDVYQAELDDKKLKKSNGIKKINDDTRKNNDMNVDDEYDSDCDVNYYDDDNNKCMKAPNSHNDMLSEREKRFCIALKLKASQYITIKTLMIKEFACKGNKAWVTSKGNKTCLDNINEPLKKKMITFMSKSGWVRAI